VEGLSAISRGAILKKNPIPPARMLLCAWCKEVVKLMGKGKGPPKEIPIGKSGFTVKDFDALSASHGVCAACAEGLREEAKALKNPASNPPAWVRDKAKWKRAVDLATVSYGKKIGRKQVREIYAVIIAIYRNLGGRVKRKAKSNPSPKEWDALVALFNEFHGFEPTEVTVLNMPSLTIPTALVKLGELSEVTYKSAKFDGRQRLYVHKFKNSRPVLAASADGRLFIVGGDYKITERGIER